MEFKQFAPSDFLKPYVACFYSFKSDVKTEFTDTVFPSGNMEVIFNLGGGTWEFLVGEKFLKTPQVELWGQITKPLPVKSKGKQDMLGIKFLTHSASCFFRDEIGTLNNHVSDLTDVLGSPVKILHARLLETEKTVERIKLIEDFLLKRRTDIQKENSKLDKVADILSSIKINATESSIRNIALGYGISPRYLHKLIYQHTGLSPKSLNKISRFQRSLQLITKKGQLTSIAYDCGYFDQSHFIRDFKSFTGLTPRDYLGNKSLVSQLLLP
jgi:AraC-like DNA-binding protein